MVVLILSFLLLFSCSNDYDDIDNSTTVTQDNVFHMLGGGSGSNLSLSSGYNDDELDVARDPVTHRVIRKSNLSFLPKGSFYTLESNTAVDCSDSKNSKYINCQEKLYSVKWLDFASINPTKRTVNLDPMIEEYGIHFIKMCGNKNEYKKIEVKPHSYISTKGNKCFLVDNEGKKSFEFTTIVFEYLNGQQEKYHCSKFTPNIIEAGYDTHNISLDAIWSLVSKTKAQQLQKVLSIKVDKNKVQQQTGSIDRPEDENLASSYHFVPNGGTKEAWVPNVIKAGAGVGIVIQANETRSNLGKCGEIDIQACKKGNKILYSTGGFSGRQNTAEEDSLYWITKMDTESEGSLDQNAVYIPQYLGAVSCNNLKKRQIKDNKKPCAFLLESGPSCYIDTSEAL